METKTLIALAVAVLAVGLLARWWFRRTEFFKSGDGKAHMTLYFATWCGHCTAFKPEWEAFASSVAADPSLSKKLSTSSVNLEDPAHKAKIQALGIDAVPMVVFQRGSNTVMYSGERTAKALMAFAGDKMR